MLTRREMMKMLALTPPFVALLPLTPKGDFIAEFTLPTLEAVQMYGSIVARYVKLYGGEYWIESFGGWPQKDGTTRCRLTFRRAELAGDVEFCRRLYGTVDARDVLRPGMTFREVT